MSRQNDAVNQNDGESLTGEIFGKVRRELKAVLCGGIAVELAVAWVDASKVRIGPRVAMTVEAAVNAM